MGTEEDLENTYPTNARIIQTETIKISVRSMISVSTDTSLTSDSKWDFYFFRRRFSPRTKRVVMMTATAVTTAEYNNFCPKVSVAPNTK